MSQTNLNWKIGGEAGFGIASAGLIFAKVLNRLSYYVFGYLEYPSLIRGGHNVYEVHFSDVPVYSQQKTVDILVCLNKETFDLHQKELHKGSIVLFDSDKTKLETTNPDYLFYPVPVAKLTKDLGGLPVMENNVFLGLSLALLSADKNVIFEVIKEIFADKGEAVISANEKMIQCGYDFVQNHPLDHSMHLVSVEQHKSLIMTGNEALSLGTIAADCRLFAAYPMTPASSILHVLASYASQSKMVVKHVGDEIEAMNLIIGSAYAGARSMTATSGGGFALMVEGLGLAGVTETGIVVVVSQRPGPATGLPTWTGQADLEFVRFSAQDEFPRIILTPGDSEEAFMLVQKAFNLADIYQTPVFVLLDKYLSESFYTVMQDQVKILQLQRGKILAEDQIKSDYFRYSLSEDGISSRSLPGQKNGTFLANSYEHTEYGFATEDAEMTIKQKNKRFQKMKTYVNQDFVMPKVYGSLDAELTIIGWGSTKGPVLEALKDYPEINFIHFNHLFPLDNDKVLSLLQRCQKTLLIEGNQSGQLGLLLREQLGFVPTDKYLRYDGRPFYPEDIKNKIDSFLKN